MPSTTPRKTAAPTKRAPRKRTAATVAASPPPNQNGDKYAPSTWGAVSAYEDLVVPSGQTCLVRRPGLEGLIKAGIVSNFDALTRIVGDQSERMKTGKEPKSDEEIMSDVMSSPERLEEMMRVINKIVIYVVVKPEIKSAPNDITLRQPAVIYDDMIDIEDKMFLMNFALGGVRDLERFRGQYESALGSVGDQPEVGDQAEPAMRDS
jgi:hypothetical protein